MAEPVGSTGHTGGVIDPAAPDALVQQLGQRFDLVDEVVTALSSPELERATSQERVKDWQKNLRQDRRRLVERLVPRVRVDIERAQPGFVGRHVDGRSASEVQAEVARLGPWRVPVPLAHGVTTMDGMKGAVASTRLLYRRDLIDGTLARLLGDDLERSSVLDIGCQAGFFSLDLAERGAASVRAIDLRPGNVAQATFLAEHHGVERVDIGVVDADELVADERFDVVLNLGLLYHVTRPLDLLRTTYELCRRVAVIDTVCSPEPVSAFLLLSDKDTSLWDEGRDVVELHPTYRAVIDGLRFAGFRHIIEVEGVADPPHRSYLLGGRRCFLAFP